MTDKDNAAAKKALGLRLQRLRKMAGLSREALAQRAGVGATSIEYWEQARPGSALKERSRNKVVKALQEAGIAFELEWLLEGKGFGPFLRSETQLFKGAEPPAPYRSPKEKEMALFLSHYSKAVTLCLKHNAMLPVAKSGDYVGGVWQAAELITEPALCLIKISEEEVDLRQLRKSAEPNIFQARYLSFDANCAQPFELNEILLIEVAPLLRLWR